MWRWIDHSLFVRESELGIVEVYRIDDDWYWRVNFEHPFHAESAQTYETAAAAMADVVVAIDNSQMWKQGESE